MVVPVECSGACRHETPMSSANLPRIPGRVRPTVTCGLNFRSSGSNPSATNPPSTRPWSCSSRRSSPLRPTQQMRGSRNDGKQPVLPTLIENFPVEEAARSRLVMMSGTLSVGVSPRNFSVRCIASCPIHRTRSCSRGLKLRARSMNSRFSVRGSSIATNNRQVSTGTRSLSSSSSSDRGGT